MNGLAAAAGITGALVALSSWPAGTASHGAASSPARATGNAAAIALARSNAAATDRMGTQFDTETGYLVIRETTGPRWSVSWKYGLGRVPAGYVPAVEHLTIGLHDGRVTWLSDLMIPSCAKARCAGSLRPLYVLETSKGLYGRFNGSTSGCYSTMHGTIDGYFIGYDETALAGTYAPLRQAGPNDILTSTVRAGGTRTWTEVAVISRATRLQSEITVHSSAGDGVPAYSYRITFSYKAAPVLPPPVTCLAP